MCYPLYPVTFLLLYFYAFFPALLCTALNLDIHILSLGKTALLDISNNSISARGAFYVAEYVKKSKSLLWLNLYMNDIGDEVLIFFSVLTI